MAMKHNIVPASAFSSRGLAYGRLDAEFVDPDMLALETQLRTKHKAVELGSLGLEDIGNYVQPEEPTGAQIKYIAIDNIDAQDGFLFHQTLSDEELPSRAKYKLMPYDLVLSNVRPERGAVGIVLDVQGDSIGSSGLTVVRLADEGQRATVFAFLRSRFARNQLIRRSRGSMYPAVTKDDVSELLIPQLPSKVLDNVRAQVAKSVEQRGVFFALSAEQTEKVEVFLSERLGPPPPDIVLDVAASLPIRIAKESEFFSGGANRFDAEFHRKEFVDYQTRLSAMQNVVQLGSVYEAFAGGNPTKGEQILSRLRQAQLSGFGVSYTACEDVADASAPEKFFLRPSDVLIACTAHEPHYVGRRVDLIDDLPVAFANRILPVPDVMVLRARNSNSDPSPAFLASFLRTKWGRHQFQRLNRGVRGGHVYGQDVEKYVYAPKPPAKWMEAFQKRQDAIRAARRGSISYMAAAVTAIESSLA